MRKKTVLLVDDVQLFLEQEKSFLDREEFEVLSAQSGREALRLAVECQPDLIMLDFYMPDMNGDCCCRLIKAVPALRETPVIMVTACNHQEDFEMAWKAGCDDIIVKPINGHFFKAIIKKYFPVIERTAPRYTARLRVQYGPEPKTMLDEYSINVSTGGLFLETPSVLQVGTSLTLSFQLPDPARTIECHGRVAWVNHPEMIKVQALPPGMGIQFLNLSLEELEAIREFIKKGALLPSW